MILKKEIILICMLLWTCGERPGDGIPGRIFWDSRSFESIESSKKAASKARDLVQRADKLHRSGSVEESFRIFDEALRTYPDALGYFEYGNALATGGRLESAIFAYENALYRGFEKLHLLYYNLACAYGRSGKAEDSVRYLEQAILHGYVNFDHIERDADLAKIRNQPRWAEQKLALKQLLNRGNQPLPAGKKIEHGVASSIDDYFFCSDGTAKINFRVSEMRPHLKFGTWKMQNYKIVLSWTRESGGKPVGKPLGCAAVCDYSKYESFDRPVTETETLSWLEIERNDLGHWEVEDYAGSCSEDRAYPE